MEYKIWYAKSAFSLLRPHADKNNLELTHELGNSIEADDLEDCFLKGQDCLPRSIAVGDVIEVSMYEFLVMPVGFKILK